MSRQGSKSQRRRKRASDRRTATALQCPIIRKILITGMRLRRLEIRTPKPAVQFINWRERYDTPPGQQGDCQSCSAFAIAATLAFHGLIRGEQLEVSPGYLHTCIGHPGELDSNIVCASAVDPSRLLARMEDTGWAVAAGPEYPYPPNVCQVGGARRRLGGYTAIRNEAEARAALLQGPLVAVMSVGAQFFSFKGNLYSSLPTLDDSLHTVCVVGCNADGWIILNSIGPDWGDNTGGTTIAYGACALLDFNAGGAALQAYALNL